MTALEQAARMALDTLERTAIRLTQGDFVLPAIAALRAALAQQAEPAEPVEPVVDAVQAAVLAEREACARQLDALGCDHCAAAIRARGEE